jgi:SAM-dependent methyltransferase
MPSSTSESIPYEIEFIRKNLPDPASVLDVGIGFGKGAFLILEFFDVKKNHLYQPKDWKVKITGVEIFPHYLSELQRLLYNEIIIGNITDVLPKLGKFDLAILGDVIEHFPKEKGFGLLRSLFDHVSDIVINTPNGFLPHSHTDNTYEEHLSGWKIEDFREFRIIDHALVRRIMKNEDILVVYLRRK